MGKASKRKKNRYALTFVSSNTQIASYRGWGIWIGVGAVVLVAALYTFWPAGETSENSILPTPSSAGVIQSVAPSPTSARMTATITTARGNIVIELLGENAPKTVENFVFLAQKHFYDGVKFHRVEPGFVIQTGDPFSKTNDPRVGSGGPGYTFKDEINAKSLGFSESEVKALEAQGYQYRTDIISLPVTVGSVAMANSGPNTNGSQFFIVTHENQPHLNGKHTVFGKVVEGMGLVRAVKQGDIITSMVINSE